MNYMHQHLLQKKINTMNDSTKEKINNIIKKNDVCLFMKGTPDVPQCGFSMAVSNVLKHLDVKFTGINVLEDNEIREGIKIFSDWPTIPQLYVKGEFVGGCDIIKEMFEKGELQKKFKEKEINLTIDESIENKNFTKISFLKIVRKYLSKKLRTVIRKK